MTSLAPAFGDTSHPPELLVHGRGFAPLVSQLRCGFEQQGVLLQTEASFESEALVRCLAPPLLAPGTARVRVSINGGDSFATEEDLARPDWTPRGDGGIFLGYDSRQPPALVAVEPSWSDAEGGSVLVVSARNLAPTARLACHFDQVGSSAATLLNATALSCVAPAAVPQARVRVRG